MEKRKTRRIRKRVMLKIDGKSAILVDISRTGIRYSTANPPKIRSVSIALRFDERSFNLKGSIRWVKRKVALQKLYDVGASLDDIPELYSQFIDELKA